MKTKSILVLVVFVWMSLFVSKALGSERENLRGLPGVFVIVEELEPDIQRDGLTDTQLQTDVELRLRKAGIRVLTEKESFNVPGKPYLYVQISSLITKGGYAFHILIGLNEQAYFTRNNSLVHAYAWDQAGMGSTSTHDMIYIRQKVGDLVDRFINDYLAVNPK